MTTRRPKKRGTASNQQARDDAAAARVYAALTSAIEDVMREGLIFAPPESQPAVRPPTTAKPGPSPKARPLPNAPLPRPAPIPIRPLKTPKRP